MKKLVFILVVFSCLGAFANNNKTNVKKSLIEKSINRTTLKSHFSPCKEAATGRMF